MKNKAMINWSVGIIAPILITIVAIGVFFDWEIANLVSMVLFHLGVMINAVIVTVTVIERIVAKKINEMLGAFIVTSGIIIAVAAFVSLTIRLVNMA